MSDGRNVKIGDRVIYRPKKRGTTEADTEYWWYGAKATVVSITSKYICISFDDYPECRNSEVMNRFMATRDELELLEEEFTSEDVRQAAIVLRKELLKHGEVYEAFVSSIESVTREINPDDWSTREVAVKVMSRIIGED